MGQQERYSTLNAAPRIVVVKVSKRRHLVAAASTAIQYDDRGRVIVVYDAIGKRLSYKAAVASAMKLAGNMESMMLLPVTGDSIERPR